MPPTNPDRRPQTAATLRRDLEQAGVRPGMTLVVHSSLSALGWVVGGAPAVVGTLLEVLGDRGTLAMTSATPLCGDPATWDRPAVPEQWLDEIRQHLPLFDIQTTPTTMGAIAECFRGWPGTLRSDHPLESVCARGPLAKAITGEHSLAFCEGVGTPWDQLHQLDSWILLLGVGFNRCTALHFAESLSSRRRTTVSRFPRLQQGNRVWVEVPDMASDHDTHFPRVGELFLASGQAEHGQVGEAPVHLFSMRQLVRFATAYFDRTL